MSSPMTPRGSLKTLCGWGRYPVQTCHVYCPRSESEILQLLKRDLPLIARGNGRAYGDSALNGEATLQMRHFNRLLGFNPHTGQLIAEAGVLLAEILEIFVPRGWFPLITPGTKFVTVGGMIAADVHGKNHHKEGSFVQSLDWLDLLTSEGQIYRCSPSENQDLFYWTVGGMGLTGVILRAAFRLRPIETAWIRQTTRIAKHLDEVIDLFEAAQDVTYSVAWIDCLATGSQLGRSVLILGEHATREELPAKYRQRPLRTPQRRKLSIPVDFPNGALNPLTVRAFNQLYFLNQQRQASQSFVDWDRFFYPLDSLLGWNRIYGRRGFVQFQCVLPLSTAREGLSALLHCTSAAGAGSFLAVLKKLGDQQGYFSFPMAGYTLALDFPMSQRTLKVLDQLEEITLHYGGRFYLAKDSHLTPMRLRQSDARVETFVKVRDAQQWTVNFASEQSKRLHL
ncbi:FAD-binding oxidoreductase [Thermosynechococcus sp. QKsg1]|uniref:FAD-binding oxidoreductase n=1 Tax=unclassified Thermosynechococcus TaxID=2622553 RepID=UPI00122DD8A2|nr:MULTISPECIES: FAD-binding oxidoreductase [unclassified Thermosynechococcus]QEQ00677.1 FAD-binding oxidoreductase [Thermosynechococcus sp. CL-1]WJI24921.1 FAD-binding oxidoreductase [Thermosynechococcus sp. B0]WKT84558.1 FAD-binding oxidoreductase [Thermosynechococcus sp. HY596]WNC63692.1 FAD-binding oxidoreductase [Thermosynechococcus sp. HY591]WNC66254.1 FAD-binding oxidoreductase [Thermosynechococcus sp. HY593]